jgi:serine/threonine protein kinase/tetratricopeptide (TPR) repeat protein
MIEPTQVEVLLDEALPKSPAEREAFLDHACKGNRELRREVERLLAAHPHAEGFLDRPALHDTAVHAPHAEIAGTIIGPYKLVEPIGEGGMGTVWMAQQTEPVKRLVALKLIKAGMDSKAVIARFENERQALALMDHPNIARVLDGGTTSGGRPYFVMDLVKGVPITRYCDEHHLTPRQRLELFLPVCQAVQHAHQKGIIHRDLKPSNVLVAVCDAGARGVPKVIDFGVAKAAGPKLTEKTLDTGFGHIVGTLEYMSPEQAEINQFDIDTRSDIYSLGVLLYELLTGSPPFSRKELEQAGMLEMLRVIREQEPSKPSTKLSTADGLPTLAANRGTEPAKLTKLLRGELDWIVMKALDKDRSRRYETANGFALDVQRYLADEPVLACPPSAGYRLRKFVRRNKGSVLATAVALLALVAGVLGTSWGMLRAEQKRKDAVDAQRAEAEALAQVTAEQAKTKAALAAETTARNAEKQARDKTLAALRAMTDDIVEAQMARGTTLTEENKEFLRKIINHFEGFATVTDDDAESRAIRAEGYHRVGLMRQRLGELKEAETAYANAIVLYMQLAADFHIRVEFRHELARTHINLGNLLRDTGRLNEADGNYNDALALQKPLAAEFPTSPEFRQKLAVCYYNRGVLFARTGRLTEAEGAWAEALAIQKQLAAEFPTRPEFRQELARTHHSIGILLRDTGRVTEAQSAWADALTLQKQLADDFPARPEFRLELAKSHNSVGLLLRDTGRLQEAEAAHAAARAIYNQLAAEFPARPDFRRELAVSHANLASLLLKTARLNEAEAAQNDAFVLFRQLVAEFPTHPEMRQELAMTHYNWANLLRETGRLKDAEAAYTEALAIQKQLAAEFPTRPDFRRDLARSRGNLGVVLSETGRLQEAEAASAETLAIYKQLVADFPARPEFLRELAISHSTLGSLLIGADRSKEAEAAYVEAITIQRQLATDFPTRPELQRELATSHGNLGIVLSSAGRLKEAEAAYAAALAIRKQLTAEFPNVPDYRSDFAATLGTLALLANRQREFSTARKMLEEAMTYHQAALQANPRQSEYRRLYRNNLRALTMSCAGLGDRSAAEAAARNLSHLGWDPPADAYDAACALAQCTPLVENNEKLDATKRQVDMKFYADAALAMLRDAISKGHKDVERMRNDVDLAPLRGHDDFEKLLVELEQKEQEKKPMPN